MNPTFGASILSWIPPMWTPEGGLFAIQQASAAGFDLLEILLPPSMEFDAPTVKRQLKQHGLKATCSLNLPQEAHIPFYPKEATRLIKAALDKASELEVDYLGGVLHSGIGVFSGKQRTREEENTLCEVWAEVAEYAGSVPFPFGVFPFSRISLSKFSCPICLHFRLPPFSHLSGSASGCHFRSGRKGNSGIGRECKVKPPVFGKNLQPYG